MNFYKLLSTFVGHFCPPNTDPDPQTRFNTDPDPGSGSTTLPSALSPQPPDSDIIISHRPQSPLGNQLRLVTYLPPARVEHTTTPPIPDRLSVRVVLWICNDFFRIRIRIKIHFGQFPARACIRIRIMPRPLHRRTLHRRTLRPVVEQLSPSNPLVRI
jgi:hypothetical protein